MSAIISARDAAGAALTGLAGTASWETLLDVSTGDPVDSPETPFTHLGGGLYRPNGLSDTDCGVVDLGATASPRRVVVGPEGVTVVGAFDEDGAMVEGLTPTVLAAYVVATGAAVSPAPSLTELGGGLYRVDDLPAGATADIDLGASVANRYVTVGPEDEEAVLDVLAPVVANLTPTAGSTIGASTPLEFDVTDDTELRRVIVAVQFGSQGAYEVVHDGDGFAEAYRGSTRTAISGGYHFSIVRRAGWRSSPTLRLFPIDTSGNETT